MTLRRHRDQWYWVARGRKAVRMARDCSARAHKEGRPDIAAYWDRWAARCTADTDLELKCLLPHAFVERFINRPTRFDGPPWWEGLDV